jgi:hypothetical protein
MLLLRRMSLLMAFETIPVEAGNVRLSGKTGSGRHHIERAQMTQCGHSDSNAPEKLPETQSSQLSRMLSMLVPR